MGTGYLAIVLSVLFVLATAAYAVCRHRKRKRRPFSPRRRSCGPGAAGAIYDLLNEEQRHAVEIIVEQRAAERRPEYPDGNLPDL
jgi:hypothetical protein